MAALTPPAPDEMSADALTRVNRAIQALRENPSPDQMAEVGAIYYANAFRQRAIACYEIAQRESPGDYRWSHLLARLYHDVGDYEKARDMIEKAKDSNPKYGPAYALAGDIYTMIGLYEIAESNYDA
ncbi:MAG: tetratricopeptide repeat protein, partial [Planctomycetota bacterium]